MKHSVMDLEVSIIPDLIDRKGWACISGWPMHSIFVDLTGGWHLHTQTPNKLVEETGVQKANWGTAYSTQNFSRNRVNVFCQILTHNGYEFARSSRWLKMELNGAVKKYNHTVCSPRCRFEFVFKSSHDDTRLCTVHYEESTCFLVKFCNMC